MPRNSPRFLHEDYRRSLKDQEKTSASNVPYEELDQEGRASNVAAASRIPEILAFAGFHLEEGKATVEQEASVRSFLKNHLEILGEAEHTGWEVQKLIESSTDDSK